MSGGSRAGFSRRRGTPRRRLRDFMTVLPVSEAKGESAHAG